MMTTGYPPHHPPMQHPAMAHPQHMPGPGPNGGQPMGQPMQMHPGASGPNAPHGAQAGPMVGAMPPNMPPGPHALSHLPPQANMFHQPANMQSALQPSLSAPLTATVNPALLQQQQHFQHQQQQQRAALLRHQMMHHQHAGMPMSFPNGANPGMTHQQMAAMQAGMHPPMRVMPQQQHQHQQQQQQQVMNHHPAAQAQREQQQHMHAIAMQQAASQSSNPGQSAPPGPPASQPPQGPMRPASQMGAHEGQASPAQASTPQHGPGPGPGPGQPPPQTQATPQPAQMPVHQRAARLAQARMVRPQPPRPERQPGSIVLRTMSCIDELNTFNASRMPNSLEHWSKFVDRHFSDTGSFRHVLFGKSTRNTKQFDIVVAALPRYFFAMFQAGVEAVHITIEHPVEQGLPGPQYQMESESKFIYWYKNGTQVVCPGRLVAVWNAADQLELLGFEMRDQQHYLSVTRLDKLFEKAPQIQSPRTNKTAKRAQQRKAETETIEPWLSKSDMPSSPVSDFGVPAKVQAFLELYETMERMQEVMAFCQQHPAVAPEQAMLQIASSYAPNPLAQGAPNAPKPYVQGPPLQRNPSGPRTPGAVPPGQFVPGGVVGLSVPPAAMNGSPHVMQNHVPSPAQAHGLVVHSQSGPTSAATVNATTSPNINNKRRRSQAKFEDDGVEVNGAPPAGAQKIKASPRVGGNKRSKANN